MDFQNSGPGIDGRAAPFGHAAGGLAASVKAGLPHGVSEALADPIVQALMAADRVDPKGVEALVRRIATRLGSDQFTRIRG